MTTHSRNNEFNRAWVRYRDNVGGEGSPGTWGQRRSRYHTAKQDFQAGYSARLADMKELQQLKFLQGLSVEQRARIIELDEEIVRLQAVVRSLIGMAEQ